MVELVGLTLHAIKDRHSLYDTHTEVAISRGKLDGPVYLRLDHHSVAQVNRGVEKSLSYRYNTRPCELNRVVAALASSNRAEHHTCFKTQEGKIEKLFDQGSISH